MDVDFLLIRNMKKGNTDAIDVFVRKYYDDILKYCTYHCSDSIYAEDLTQETFFKFFTKLPDYHHMGKAKNYLYTIAGNLCKNYYKKVKETVLEEEILLNQSQTTEFSSDVLTKLEVECALEQLSYELKDVVILYYFQELKLSEIASVLDIGLPLVKYRMRQAKIQLGNILGREA